MKRIFTLLAATLLLATSGFAQNLTQADFAGVVVPQYASNGNNSGAANGPTAFPGPRLAVPFRATVSNLTAGTTYRYYVQAAIAADLGGTGSGAGNLVFINPGTAPGTATILVPGGLPSMATAGQYGTFTANATGSYTGWFAYINSNNATRFRVAGTVLRPTITLATDAAPGTIVARRALDQPLTLLAYDAAAGANNGTLLRGSSLATAKNLAFTYDNAAGTGRPLSGALIENIGAVTGTTQTGANAYTYSTAAGDYTTVVPNTLPTGIRRVEERSVLSGAVANCALSPTGLWPSGANTVNPAGGAATALVLTALDTPLNAGCGAAPANQPTVASFAPASGVAGTSVVVTGTNLTGTTAVTLNGTAAPGFAVNAAGTQLTVAVPVGATTGPIAITTPSGTGSSATGFAVNQPRAGRVLLDGYRETAYGAAQALQTAATGFGNSTSGAPLTASGGSELDGAYTRVSGDSLYVFVAGNLESNGNVVDVFFDSRAGGQNVLSAANPSVDGNGLNNAAGLTFDAGFAADYYLGLKGTATGVTAFFATLGAGGAGIDPASSGTGRVLALNLGNGRAGTLAFDQSNTGGVDGAAASAGLAGAVVTGLEFVLPLAALGAPSGSLKVAAFVNGGSHDFLSNQVLAGVPAGTANLGTASAVNFNTPAGNQYFTVAVPVAATAPTITSFSPASGPVGTTVTVTGTNFTGATSASVNGTAGTNLMVMSATSVMFDVAAGSTTGPVRVTTAGGTATSATNFTVVVLAPVPTIASISPTTGPSGTAVTVTVTGTGFTASSVAQLNGTAYPTTFGSATSVSFVVPASLAAGTYALTVFNAPPAGGTSNSVNFVLTAPVLTPTIASFTPATGPVGTVVTVTGTNLTGATAATVNGTPATGVSASSATSLTLTVPAGATSGVITVTTPAGTATSTGTFAVTVPAGPSVALVSVSPARAVAGGPAFTLTVSADAAGGLSLTSTVEFRGVQYPVATVNMTGTSATVLIPASAIATVANFPVRAFNGSTQGTGPTTFSVVPAATTLAYEDFEQGSKSGYAAAAVALRSGSWEFTNALVGDLFQDRVNQAKAARVRGAGSVAMTFDKPTGAGTVTVQAANYGNDTGGGFKLEISTNAGVSYTQVGADVTGLGTALATYTFTPNQAGNVRLRFSGLGGAAATNRINLDDVTISNVSGVRNPVGPALAAYPNPTADLLTLALPGTALAARTAVVRDLLGRRVAELPLSAPAQVSLRGLPAGTYFLDVAGRTVRVTKE